VLFNKATVAHSGVKFEESVLGELIRNMGTVAGVLHIVPADFVTRVTYDGLGEGDLFGLTVRNWVPLAIRDNPGFLELYVDIESTTMHFRVVNKGREGLSGIAVAINRNAIGMAFADTPLFPAVLEAGEECEVDIPLVFQEAKQDRFDSAAVDVAVKTNLGTYFASTAIPLEFLTLVDGNVEADQFQQLYGQMAHGDTFGVPSKAIASDGLLRSRNVFVVGKRENRTYVSFMVPPACLFLAELTQHEQGVTVSVKTRDPKLIPIVKSAAASLFIENAGK
jgi:hypothetical protein